MYKVVWSPTAFAVRNLGTAFDFYRGKAWFISRFESQALWSKKIT